VIEYSDPGANEPGRGGWFRNADGLAKVSHPDGGKRTVIYGGGSSLWPFDPYNGPEIYGQRGTFVHALCDLVDGEAGGSDAGIAEGEALGIPADLQAHIATRWTALLERHGFTVAGIEVPAVCDRAKVATNIDRVLIADGKAHIADIKTSGDIVKPSYLLQLAACAESVPYHIGRAQRMPWDTPIDQDIAYILHYPLTAAIRCDDPADWPDWCRWEVKLHHGRRLLDLLLAFRDGDNFSGAFMDEHTAAGLRAGIDEVADAIGDNPAGNYPTLDELRAIAAAFTPADKAALREHMEANAVDKTDPVQVAAAIDAVRNFGDVVTVPAPRTDATTVPKVIARPSVDEGATIDDDTVAAMGERFGNLDAASRSWVSNCGAKVRLSPQHGGVASERRHAILSGLAVLAESDGFNNDDILRGVCALFVGDDAWRAGVHISAVVASLDLPDALRFRQAARIVSEGMVAINWTDDGRCVVSESVAA
jgi:hypothetical protein